MLRVFSSRRGPASWMLENWLAGKARRYKTLVACRKYS
jgi:hypothetical protein